MTATAVPTTILEGARALARPGRIVEVRILGTPRGAVSGYFDDLEILARAVAQWDGRANIYVTLNPVNPALLARARNRLREYAKTTTTDRDVICRAWFPIDLDPKRPTGISSTAEELAAALTRRNEVMGFLRDLGFPDGIRAMSGNGGHALYAVDLPNDDVATKLFENALKALKKRFGDNAVDVDGSVFNAARIWKLYGTIAVKGDATPERPHRRAEIEHVPGALELADRDVLVALAAMVPPARMVSAPTGRTLPPLDLVGLVQGRGWYLRALHGGKHAMTCPWASEHSGESGLTETVIFEPRAPGEPWGFDCKHAHCAGRTIRDVLALVAPPNGDRHHPLEPAVVSAPASPEPYTFTPSVGAGHFLADYIAYASARTDAAHELHEASGLILLAAATPRRCRHTLAGWRPTSTCSSSVTPRCRARARRKISRGTCTRPSSRTDSSPT
jgi:hypothetical protein